MSPYDMSGYGAFSELPKSSPSSTKVTVERGDTLSSIERENNNCYNWDCLKKEFKIPVTYSNSNRTNVAKAQQELRYPSHALNESDWENFSNGGRTPDYSRNNIKIGQQSLPPARTYPHAPTDPDKKIKIFNIKCEYKPSDILR